VKNGISKIFIEKDDPILHSGAFLPTYPQCQLCPAVSAKRGAKKSIVRAGGADGAIARGERREAARNPGRWRGSKSSPEGATDYANK